MLWFVAFIFTARLKLGGGIAFITPPGNTDGPDKSRAWEGYTLAPSLSVIQLIDAQFAASPYMHVRISGMSNYMSSVCRTFTHRRMQ